MDRIYSTALGMTQDQLDAEDLVQSSYLRAWKYFNRFEMGSNFSAWFHKILVNNYINEYRKKKRQPLQADFETTLAAIGQEKPDQDADARGSHLNVDYAALFDDSITRAFDRLPERLRLVVLLTDVNDLRYREVAEMLNCPIGTVMSRLHRGRQIMAKILRGYASENGYVKG
jgi:RNA polymerase sigma-70 factor (ECF subfamily)